MMNNLTVSDIEQLREGRSKASRTRIAYASVSRRAGKYEIEGGWSVPEADDDDGLTCTYQPLAAPGCWIGRRMVTDDAATALTLYTAAKAAVYSAARMWRPEGGIVIGSVMR